GRYTGLLEFYAYGVEKAGAMREIADRIGLDLAGSYAYSDSITDLPMLEAVGHPVAVNADKELRRLAEERDWERRDFRSPVRLRTRIVSAVPAPKPSYVAGAFGVVAVAAITGGGCAGVAPGSFEPGFSSIAAPNGAAVNGPSGPVGSATAS